VGDGEDLSKSVLTLQRNKPSGAVATKKSANIQQTARSDGEWPMPKDD